MGVAIADYDNDGRDDVYITALEGDRLFHNEGNGKFRDVTKAVRHPERQLRHQRRLARLRPRRQAGSVRRQLRAVDAEDRSLVLARRRDEILLHAGILQGHARRACIHNLGGGKFEDVAEAAGVGDPTSKSLGVTVLDYNGDGWPDLFVANDTQPNKLYRNTGNGTFTEERHGGRRGLRRGRRGARRDGRRCRRLRSQRPAAPAGRQLLQPDARPLSQRRQRPVRGRSAVFRGGPRQPAVAGLRRLLLRLRPGRLSRHLRRQRPHRGGDRPRAAEGQLPSRRRCCSATWASTSSRT